MAPAFCALMLYCNGYVTLFIPSQCTQQSLYNRLYDVLCEGVQLHFFSINFDCDFTHALS